MKENFSIPRKNIALHPANPPCRSKLMVIRIPSLKTEDIIFRDIVEYLKPSDAMAVNDSRVINARIRGKRETGGKTEFLLVEKNQGCWSALGKPASKISEGITVEILSPSGKKTAVEVIKKEEGGIFVLKTPDNILKYGYIPLPPYITAERDVKASDETDYRSVFSRREGSVASATASLHFTDEIVRRIKDKGVKIASVTLHVGPGTFMDTYRDPPPERFSVSGKSAGIINSAPRTLICGTTVMRALESSVREGKISSASGKTSLYIKAPYRFTSRGMFLTNFHLPGTPLIDLVAAYIDEKIPGGGAAAVEKIYRLALEKDYRFLSYGDAMLVIDDEQSV